MAISWTDEQKAVIESRNRNLLVSAAAGSGKTAVLVERIIRMITEGEEPLRIDQLLVMTFTKAAADEMRERILKAVDEKLMEHPDNTHLQIQAAMIPYAKITTIHSFCLGLIREHYNKLTIDPAFRVGDEGELILLRADVMKEMLEDFYEAADPRFEQFVETYANGKTDHGIEDYIMQVYTFSQSNPWPEVWLEHCRAELLASDMEQMMETDWMKFLMADAALQVTELAEQIKRAAEVCEEENGPEAYLPMMISDLRLLNRLLEATDYETLNQELKQVAFDRLASIRKKEIDQEKKAYVTGVRDRVKKAVSKLSDLYSFESPDEVLSDIQGTKEAVAMLLDLAGEYARRYQEKKQEKNLVDFNDLEHYALEILLKQEDDQRIPSDAADELSKQFEEILVDEYQDSNDVQEALISSISRERFGTPNVFMVGDVKQSIYQFRLARPQLFLDKYEAYSKEEGKYQKIELHQNFRSRDEVLTGINEIFYQIMTKNLGNIRYTKDTALHPGAFYPEGEGRVGEKPELLMIHAEGNLLKQLDDDGGEFTSRELEAKAIAAKIREFVHPETGLLVFDKNIGKTGGYRTARYGDMVILLRSLSGWAEDFVNVLMNEGIPAYAERKTGYFTAIEVEVVLSMLNIIDNPMQDIPLAAVLRSPVGEVTDEEMAHMTALFKKKAKKEQDRGIYGAWQQYLKEYEEAEDENYPKLYRKLNRFSKMLTAYRTKAAYLSIHELLYDLYEGTGYYDYVSAMPAGEVRRANLAMLVEKASAYEKTSYTGLFHFIRYIENLKKYDTDFGEASLSGDENTVRVMSIHKSKGLEFPVVFLAGMGKKFNKQDAYGKILIDPDLGIGTDYLDLERRIKAPTLKKHVLRRKTELGAMGEELRVLYVAMTRAKEKLVMTGLDRYLEKKMERYQEVFRVKGEIPFTILSTADSYLDWMLMSLSGKYSDTAILLDEGQDTGSLIVRELPVSDLVGREVERQAGKKLTKERLLSLDTTEIYDMEFERELAAAFGYQYPYESEIGLHTKLSVSELKKQGQFLDEEESEFLPTIPKFLKEDGEGDAVRGAYRGTAYHRVLELLDFGLVQTEADISQALVDFSRNKRMDEESISLISNTLLLNFLTSPLGNRLSMAQRNEKLKKEQQFVIGIPAREMDLGDSTELILVQGIIDAYMEEEDGLVLVDYKTDHIRKGEEQVLIDRYQIQLNYYKRALEQMTGKKVKEAVIYSFALQKEVVVIGS
ncbi:helicase-exonuclease AddAB subunit AddA [Lacrimispora algidixylanolytica]|uniref:ATP-dependent helicase/nuclease subunit A n=1 Tax=Lacrimispora algidixylanolytica TaxID=94868 RepID=A0A419SZK4_9FIRM|nr:helicase-exonuclease AddAB subunit AddA [Lacrimispora algidixylanolytica]RKD30714.1 helicase-exonuclease AddAB subunit AddA [Lacrimispora algidixylanolytica]